MKRGVQALAVVALTTLVSCGAQLPPTTSTPVPTPATLRIYDTPEVAPFTSALTSAYSQSVPQIQVEIETSTRSDMLDRLLNREVPYFISNHLPLDERLWAAPLARDALAIITNPTNPVDELSPEQIRRMYQGFSTDWLDVSNFEATITVFSEGAGSGTRAEFERLLMGQQRTSPNAQVVPSTPAMLASIASQAGAIGYAPFSQVNNTVRVLSINGTPPSHGTIVSNTYPLRLTLYFIGLEQPNGPYQDFVTWVQSPAGQRLLSQQYAPLPS